MSQANNLRRCHTTLDQDRSLIAVVEMTMRLWNPNSHRQLEHPTKNNCGAGSGVDPIFQRFYASDGNYAQVLPGPYADPLLGTNVVAQYEEPVVIWLPSGDGLISSSMDGRLKIWHYAGQDVLCAQHPLS